MDTLLVRGFDRLYPDVLFLGSVCIKSFQNVMKSLRRRCIACYKTSHKMLEGDSTEE
mgnify:CR=1 FL=1